jgi:type III pantothenate kinase
LDCLAFDVGNSATKVGHFSHGDWRPTRVFETVEEALEAVSGLNVDHHIVSSVAHTPAQLSQIFAGIPSLLIMDWHTPVPLHNAYGTPQTLGVDRLAAAVGANARHPDRDVLIIDIGTAIKYDLVDAENTFRGGMIAPGRRLRFQALHTFTQKLPLVESAEVPALLGTSTESCIQSGVMNGIAAELNGVIESYQESYNPVVLLCGGDATLFETQIKYPTFAAPNLVLEGLIRILLYNVAEA